MTESIKEAIRKFAAKRAPHEACGFVLVNDKYSWAHETPNVSSAPEDSFRISADSYERAELLGQIKMIWHSHYNRSPDPGMADKVMCEKCRIPFLIVAHPSGEFSYYEPSGYEAPLLGRPFLHGVLDCYGNIRDSFKREKGIELPDFEREDDWWKRGQDLFMDNFQKAGFVMVDEIQPYDVILMQINSQVINHAALYLGDGMMRHHIQGRISMEVPYVTNMGYYAKHTRFLIRHKDLFERDVEINITKNALKPEQNGA